MTIPNTSIGSQPVVVPRREYRALADAAASLVWRNLVNSVRAEGGGQRRRRCVSQDHHDLRCRNPQLLRGQDYHIRTGFFVLHFIPATYLVNQIVSADQLAIVGKFVSIARGCERDLCAVRFYCVEKPAHARERAYMRQ